jgi:hypothetical protein
VFLIGSNYIIITYNDISLLDILCMKLEAHSESSRQMSDAVTPCWLR